VEKTLNRHVFTILKTCFLDLSIPFPLNPGRTLLPICEALEFWGEEVRGGLFSSPTNAHSKVAPGDNDYWYKYA
jgi:hypothetical protein